MGYLNSRLPAVGNSIAIIEAGQSLPFVFSRDDPTGWTCTIKVLKNVGDTPSIERTITLDSNSLWSGHLTTTETAALAIGLWRIQAVLTNSTEAELQTHRFQVNEAWDTV